MSVAPAPEPERATDDEDSLFGSPPPDPRRGSSSQLALPAIAGDIQNVGTIALPGSQSCIELAPNPAALLLSSFPGPPLVPSATSPTTSRTPTPNISHPPPPSRPRSNASTREHSRVPRARPPQKGKEKDQTLTPRPPPPPIALPDPDQPPPPNFLRNQQALLGHAGLVSGINPATLAQRHNQGNSSQNPIVIEDGPTSPRPSPNLQIPLPLREEIILTLARSKNIYPVLQSIKHLLSNDGPPGSMRNELSQNDDCQGPPTKRRKLHKVPAGAVDWDVPYPFQEDATPEGYRSWKKERVKQLVAQLVSLVKEAANTVAAKIRRRNMDALGVIPPPSPPSLPQNTHRTAPQDSMDVVDAQIPHPLPSSSSSMDPSAVAAVEQMFAQIFPGSELLPPSTSDTTPSESNTLPDVGSSSFNPIDVFPGGDPFQQSQFDELMAMLESNPIPPMPDGSDPFMDGLFAASEQVPAYPPPSTPFDRQSRPFDNIDTMIDPALLALSLPEGQRQSSLHDLFGLSVVPPTPALAQSPIASTSSLAGPPTPRWDGSPSPADIEVYRPEHDEGDGYNDRGAFGVQWDGMKASTTTSRQSSLPSPIDVQGQPPRSVEQHPTRVIQSQPESAVHPLPQPSLDPNPVLHSPPQPTLYPHIQPTSYPAPLSAAYPRIQPTQPQVQASPQRASSARPSIQPRPIAPAPSNPSASSSQLTQRTATKQEILRRAKERRAQLAAELERAKVELWETTIEQGVLAHLVKEANKS